MQPPFDPTFLNRENKQSFIIRECYFPALFANINLYLYCHGDTAATLRNNLLKVLAYAAQTTHTATTMMQLGRWSMARAPATSSTGISGITLSSTRLEISQCLLQRCVSKRPFGCSLHEVCNPQKIIWQTLTYNVRWR